MCNTWSIYLRFVKCLKPQPSLRSENLCELIVIIICINWYEHTHSALANRLAAPSLRGTASHQQNHVCCPGFQMVEQADIRTADTQKHISSDYTLVKKMISNIHRLLWCWYIKNIYIAITSSTCSLAFLKHIVFTWFLLFWVCTLMVECKSLWIKASAKLNVM